MKWVDIVQSIVTALVLAGIFAAFRLFRDVDQLKTKTEPLVEWWKKTSLDAIKIATNPTSKRLTELAERYVATIKGERGKLPLSMEEKQELIDGLKEIMNNQYEFASKRQSASMSLRFIETREGLSSKPLNKPPDH